MITGRVEINTLQSKTIKPWDFIASNPCPALIPTPSKNKSKPNSLKTQSVAGGIRPKEGWVERK